MDGAATKVLPMQPPAPIAVLGAGAFGTALAMVVAESGASPVLWGRAPERMREMRRVRENAAHLPGLRFPASLRITEEIGEALGAEGAEGGVALLAVPT